MSNRNPQKAAGLFIAQSANHLLLTLTLGVLFASIVIAIPFTTQAQTGGPQTQVTATPEAPPPLNPQIQGPAFNRQPMQVTDRAATRAKIEGQEFHPQIRINRGDSLVASNTATPKQTIAPAASLKQREQNTERQPDLVGPRFDINITDQSKALESMGWVLKGGELFENSFAQNASCGLISDPNPPLWSLQDYGADDADRTWGEDDHYVYADQGSAWPARGGEDGYDPEEFYYNDNLNSWMTCGPFDFSNASDVYVEFYYWLDSEIDYDWLFFGASTDNSLFDGIRWSGKSDDWVYEPTFLTNYAGHSQVWFTWNFESDDSNPVNYDGAWVDQITIWAYEPPIADTQGDLVHDGSFENDGENWVVESFAVQQKLAPTDAFIDSRTAVDGEKSALLMADGVFDDFLYQDLTIPNSATDIELNFWFAVSSDETVQDTDYFCASLADFDTSNLIVDLGCLDATFSTGVWQEVIYSLTANEVAQAVNATNVSLVFELYNRGGANTGTSAWIDAVQLYAIGGGAGNHIDDNEPNDTPDAATALTCGTTVKATIGDIVESYGDVDWYELSNLPDGQLIIDIKADTQSPPSALDSVISLYDSQILSDPEAEPIAFNDDDVATYDSYISRTVTTGDYYLKVESYDGYGSSDSFYDLDVHWQTCIGQAGSPPQQETTTSGAADTWTAMLYLNAEDPNFEKPLRQYIKDLETVVAGKTDFLKITVLFDGPKSGDTVRYLISPTGVYTPGVNLWKLNEQNVGDRDTLATFLKWSMDTYPAEHYYAAIDDHGHGVYGISWDRTNNNDELRPPEVYSALKEATNNGQRKIDIIDSEACLMGLAEHAYDVQEWADYVVASQQINWTLDTYPNYFNTLQGSHTPLQLGQHIVNTIHNLANADSRPHTISLIDTAQMGGVKAQMSALGTALMSGTPSVADVKAARDLSQAFAADADATNPALADYVDLWDLADKAASKGLITAIQAQNVKDAVEAAVIAEQHANGTVDAFTWTHDDAHGLSVYYPAGNASSAFSDYINGRLFKITEDDTNGPGTWDDFLRWAVTEAGNGVSNGIGGNGDRKGMAGARFLQPKLGAPQFMYMPVILK